MISRIVLLATRIALAAGALALSACGWHLRGSAALPGAIMPVRIDATDEFTDFYRELRGSLLSAGATLAEAGAASGATVRIRGDRSGQRVLTVSSLNRPVEYSVYYHIEYAIERGGRELTPMQSLELTSTYSYDANLALAKQREQLNVQRALARELAHAVLRRLSSIKADQAGERS